MKPRKLLFVVNLDSFFISHRLPIALEAQRQGYQVHLATKITNKYEELNNLGISIHPLTMSRSSTNLLSLWFTLHELWVLFRKVKPDIVHLVTIKPILLGGLVARFSKVPAVVAAVSGLGFIFIAKGIKASFRRQLVGFLYKIVFNHGNIKIIFQNQDDWNTLANWANLPNRKIRIIPGSGVNLDQFQKTSLPVDSNLVILAARLLKDKGVLEFIEAAILLKQQGVSARFCLVGSTDKNNPASMSDDELIQWQNTGAIELWGHSTDMREVLRKASIVVLPSYREGLPKILIEAAACGRPVITTNVPGCRDAIIPNVSGLLVPVQDSVALAQAIRTLIDQPIICANMGDAGRLLAESKFNVNHVVAEHIKIYNELTVYP